MKLKLANLHSDFRASCRAATTSTGGGNFSFLGGPFCIPVHSWVSLESSMKKMCCLWFQVSFTISEEDILTVRKLVYSLWNLIFIIDSDNLSLHPPEWSQSCSCAVSQDWGPQWGQGGQPGQQISPPGHYARTLVSFYYRKKQVTHTIEVINTLWSVCFKVYDSILTADILFVIWKAGPSVAKCSNSHHYCLF